MKQIFLLLVLIPFLHAYSQKTDFHLTIKVFGLDTGSYPIIVREFINLNKDSTLLKSTVSKDENSVTIKGYIPEEKFMSLAIMRQGLFGLGIGPGDSGTIELHCPILWDDFIVKGSNRIVQSSTFMNKVYGEQEELLEKQSSRVDSLMLANATQNKLSAAKTRYEAIYDSIFFEDMNYADTVNSAVAAGFALDRFCYRKDKYDISKHLNKAIQRFGKVGYLPAVLESYNSKNPQDEIFNPILRTKDSLKITEIFSNPNLALVKKAQRTNKLVLIDFWASWCKPCIDELPYLNDAYTKFHNRRFEIVSISIDTSSTAWQYSLNKFKQQWKFQGIELRGLDSQPASLLKIKSIPQNYLIDGSGKIYGHNLRKENLSKLLSQLL